MKIVVQVFEPGEAESMSHRERVRAVEKALVHHALQLEELAGLLKELCSQDLSDDDHTRQVDSDLYMPTLRLLIQERHDILSELENEYNRVDKMDFEDRHPPAPKKPTLVTA